MSNRCHRSYPCEFTISADAAQCLSFGPRQCRPCPLWCAAAGEDGDQDVQLQPGKAHPGRRRRVCPLPRCTAAHIDDVTGQARARLRPGSRPDTRGMAGGAAVPQRHRADLHRQAARVHPAVRHAGPVDDGGGAGPGAGQRAGAGRDGCHRSHGRRSVLLGRRTGAALGCRPGRGRARRAGAVHGPCHRHQRQAPGRRVARCLVGRRRRQVRRAAVGGADDEGARPPAHRQRRPLLVLVDPPELLPGARRRPGRRHAARHPPQHQPARATST